MVESVVKETEIQWMKHDASRFTSLLAKDVVVVGGGSFLNFVETSRTDRREVVYHANSEVRGDGVGCYCTHRVVPCFAFAEMSRNPRILIISYPGFEIVKTFECNNTQNYIQLRFSDMEFLVALTGIPDYKIIIWNWRTAEKMYSQETGITSPRQILRISPTSPLQVVQAATAERQVLFWDMSLCYKKTLLNRTCITLPETSRPPYNFSYGADGDLYLVDSEGSLYSINGETHVCTLQLSRVGQEEAGEDELQTLQKDFTPGLVWHKGGLVFSTPAGAHFWKRKSPEGWTKIWSFTPRVPFRSFLSSVIKDLLVGVNCMNEIIVLKGEAAVDTVTIRTIGSGFDFLCMIYPVGDYLVTYGNVWQDFIVWNKLNGWKVTQFKWSRGKVTALESNPKWPYIVATTAEGSAASFSFYEASNPLELDNIPLTANPLDAIRFRSQGTQFCVANMDVGEFFLLKGPLKLEVVAYLKVDLKIVDFVLVEKDANLQLLIVPMSQLCCRSGQNILVYVLEEKAKGFEYLKDVAMPSVVTSVVPSSSSPKELFCAPHRSRKVYRMNLNNGKMTDEFVSGHQMKFFSLLSFGEYLLTFGLDGLLIVKLPESNQCATLWSSHHRLAKGARKVVVDPYMKYVVSLGHSGSLVCVLLKTVGNQSRKPELEALMESPAYKVFQAAASDKKTKAEGETTVRFQPLEPKKVWLDLRRQEEITLEEQQSRKEKQSIQEELGAIKKQLRQLLDENFANVPERQLPVQAFDLDKVLRRKKLEDAKAEREKEKQFQLAAMKNLNRITEVIRKVCWDSIEVKGREVQGILTPVVVHSYPLPPESKMMRQRSSWLAETMKLERVFHKGDFFEPWVPRSDSALELHINNKFEVSSLDVTQAIKTKFEEEQMDDDRIKAEKEQQKWRYVWTGTSTHNFVEVDPNHYSQFELTTFLQGTYEIDLIQSEVKKLMLWFNKEFTETFALKEREMAFVQERNNRLRHIIGELSFFNFSPGICSTQIYDPQWAPEENPETIMTVEDKEITVPMYVSESKMDLIRKKEAEAERLRQLMMADDFKERALVVMMDGVLEKLWEDEIKKDVPKPKCMVEKDPENWTEDDLKAIRLYEEAVKFLASERERYRKILEADWAKTVATVKDSVSKFDEKLTKLHLLKLKVESAIGQEMLKALRIRRRGYRRIEMERKEEMIKSQLLKNEKKMEAMSAEQSKLLEMLNECRNFYENLQNRDRNLEKNFKREFPEYSPIICEQLFKQSKKRPKLLQKATACSTVLVDMGKCAVSGSKPEYMPTECIQYLKDIDALDAHSNAPASVSPQSWELACKMRRQKIDMELRIRACAIELADAEATVAGYQKSMKAAKEHHGQLQNDLQALRARKLTACLNYEIQLVLKKGWVEIPLTGRTPDFAESILVTKDILNDINRCIHKMGQQKIKAMQKAANFRKGIIYKEWEHKKLRMEIEDLKNRLETVEKLQVLKELQAILIARARGFSDEKGFLYLENELATIKENFEKSETEIYGKMDEAEAKIQKINAQNAELEERIAELNVEVNEMNLARDKTFEKKYMAENMRRMKNVRERSKVVRKIQDQHNEILVLQTELELLRLKTYPAIKYRIP